MSEASIVKTQRLHPSIVLSAYLEPLVRGRRVAILGEATAGLAEELAERGARLVHVYDPDPARVAEALARLAPGGPQAVTFAPFAGDFGVRDGAFEVVIAADLTLFADPADTMRRARKLVPATGVAVLGVPNAARARTLVSVSVSKGDPERVPLTPPSSGGVGSAGIGSGGAGSGGVGSGGVASAGAAKPLGYYELYDLVSLQFARVRMVGQAPFVGYTVADFAPNGEPDVSIDTSLVSTSEEPEHFLAIASDRPVTVDAYTVVALPWREVADEQRPDPAIAIEAERGRALGVELEKAKAVAAEGAGALTAMSSRASELDAELALRSREAPRDRGARGGQPRPRGAPVEPDPRSRRGARPPARPRDQALPPPR